MIVSGMTSKVLCFASLVKVHAHQGALRQLSAFGVVQVVPCLAIFDTMKYIGSDVGTVGFGGCMGMSGFLLAVGKKVRVFV